MVKTGLDNIKSKWPKSLNGASAGLVVNPSSVNGQLEHAVDVLRSFSSIKLKALFGPQHGIRGETQDNMVEWQGFKDKRTGLPVFSLYGSTREPLDDMLRGLDVLIIDMQDAGARYYTFIWTMALCMNACEQKGISLVILDRPNPINGSDTEGPVLDPAFTSFVGLYPIPVRHGMTIGEIGVYLKDVFFHDLELIVIKMRGWSRKMWFDDTGLPWVLPSPNLPTLQSSMVYPGMCLLEGTNMSEGRGTTRPFEIFGAPYIEPYDLVRRLRRYMLPGVGFRPLYFEPTFQKYAGKLCGGAQLHVEDRKKFRPFRTGVAVVKAVHDLFPERFKWKQPPYEYEREKLPFDILCGTDRIRKDIEGGKNIGSMVRWWEGQCSKFDHEIRRRCIIYEK
ncbi:MAG: DUF1343 domain-containing protein [Nitrospirota bacterium]|nr:MAG: DUF1343 domain-containing protein [Nitrospirota bacterium]